MIFISTKACRGLGQTLLYVPNMYSLLFTKLSFCTVHSIKQVVLHNTFITVYLLLSGFVQQVSQRLY